jgi:hypothetical protein
VLTNLVFPRPASTGISLAAEDGETGAIGWRMWNLASAWTDSGK